MLRRKFLVICFFIYALLTAFFLGLFMVHDLLMGCLLWFVMFFFPEWGNCGKKWVKMATNGFFRGGGMVFWFSCSVLVSSL